MEVRAKRLAGIRSSRLLLGGDDTGGVLEAGNPQRNRLHGETMEQAAAVASMEGHSRTRSWEGARGGVRDRFPGYLTSANGGIINRSVHAKGRPLETLRFVGASASELKMSEVPALLAEHQRLARLCEELLAERGELLGHRRRRS